MIIIRRLLALIITPYGLYLVLTWLWFSPPSRCGLPPAWSRCYLRITPYMFPGYHPPGAVYRRLGGSATCLSPLPTQVLLQLGHFPAYHPYVHSLVITPQVRSAAGLVEA